MDAWMHWLTNSCNLCHLFGCQWPGTCTSRSSGQHQKTSCPRSWYHDHTHRHNPFPSSVYHDLPRSKRWATIRHQRNPRRRAPRSTPSSVACVTFSIVVHPSCDCLHSTFGICFYSAVKSCPFIVPYRTEKNSWTWSVAHQKWMQRFQVRFRSFHSTWTCHKPSSGPCNRQSFLSTWYRRQTYEQSLRASVSAFFDLESVPCVSICFIPSWFDRCVSRRWPSKSSDLRLL